VKNQRFQWFKKVLNFEDNTKNRRKIIPKSFEID